MSFLTPKTEAPSALSDLTPGRAASQSPTQVLPLVFGRGRVVVQWVTPVLNWNFAPERQTTKSRPIFFSSYGWVCHGPVDEINNVIVNGKHYTGFYLDRADYPGIAHVDLTVANVTPAYFRAWWGLEDHANYSAYLQSLVGASTCPNMVGKAHPAYRGICAFSVKDMYAGESFDGSTPALPQIELEIYRRSPAAYSFGGIAWGTNPVGIVKDLLTLKRGGRGLPASLFDADKWTAAMQRVTDVGVAGIKGTDLYMSLVLATPKQCDEAVADVLSYLGAFLVERNGQLEIDWSAADASLIDEGDLREISEHELADDDVDEDPGTLEALPSQVIVTGLDYASNPVLSEASESAPIPTVPRQVGEQREPETVAMPGWVTRAQLKSYATLRAAMRTNPVSRYTVPVLRQYAVQLDSVTPLRPGDLFVLNLAGNGGKRLVLRITERSSDDGVKVILKCQRERGTFPKPAQPVLDPRLDLTIPPPADLARYTVAQLPPDLSDAADTFVAALVERPNNSATSFEVDMNATNTWPGIVIDAVNPNWAVCAVLQTTLASALVDVTVTVDTVGSDWSYLRSQAALEQSDDALLMYRNGEWFSVGTITPFGGGSYTLAVKRARLGSLPSAHAIGNVMFVVHRNSLRFLQHTEFANVESAGVYNAGTATKYFKLRPLGVNGQPGNFTAAFSLQLRDPTPDQPTGLNGAAGTGRIVHLYWTAVVGALVNEYQVERATGPGFAVFALIAETGNAFYTDVTPAADLTYRYRVRAMTTDETESPWSATVDVAVSSAVGPPGANAKLVVLTSDAQTFQIAKTTGTVTPASITLTATGQNLAGAPVFSIAAGTATLTGAGATRVLTYANLTSEAVTVKVLWDAVEDYLSIVKVREGTDAIVSFLSNEAHTLPANAAGVVSSFAGAVSEMKVFRGATDDTANWTFSKVDTACTSALVGSTATVSAMAADVAHVDITAARAGFTSQVKRFSITKSRVGLEGAPADPGVMTLAGSGTYLGAAGTVMSYLQFNVPALPAGANHQHIEITYAGGGAIWEVRGVSYDVAASTFRLDDLTPGATYGVRLKALSPDEVPSNPVVATGGLGGGAFLAPGKTSLPSAPTSVVYVGGSNSGFGREAVFSAGSQMFVVRANWTPPIDKDVVAYEWAVTTGDTNADADAAPKQREVIAEAILTAGTPISRYFRVRSIDTSGNASAWAGGTTNMNTAPLWGLAAGTMVNQNASSVAVTGGTLTGVTNLQTTGITTGASARKVVVRQPIYTTLNLGGGVAQETVDFSLSGFGFSTRPDAGWLRSSDYDRMDIRYDIDDSTSSNAKLRVTMTDGANVPTVSGMEVTGEFVEYD